MRYKLLGNSGLKVSELCLGTMTFGNTTWGTEEADAARMYTRFREAGGNFIDTANEMYGEGRSEEFLGRFVKEERDDVVIGTKYSFGMPGSNNPNIAGNHRKSLKRSVESSLRRMGTDYIDLLWIHCWDEVTPLDEVLRALDDLVGAGKVLYLGISNAPAWVISRANTIAELRGWSQFIGVQMEYNLIERGIEREFVPMADALNLGITAWSPLASGILSGKYDDPDNRESRRLDSSPLKAVDERNLAIAREVGKIARELGKSSPQVALNWLRAKPRVIPLVGARTLKQYDDNFGCLDFQLSADEVARLDNISAFEPGYPYDFIARTKAIVHGGFQDKLDLS